MKDELPSRRTEGGWGQGTVSAHGAQLAPWALSALFAHPAPAPPPLPGEPVQAQRAGSQVLGLWTGRGSRRGGQTLGWAVDQ